MIAPEYFNNNIAVEGYIIVKNVPNEQGTLLLWNPSTKKLATRTNSEFISDMSLMTTNTTQDIIETKWFKNSSGTSNWNDHKLIVFGEAGSKAGMTFFSAGLSIGVLDFDGDYHFKFYTGPYTNIKTNGYIKDGSDNNYILLGGGGHRLVSDFATPSQLGNYLPLYGGTITGDLNISQPDGTSYGVTLPHLRLTSINLNGTSFNMYIPQSNVVQLALGNAGSWGTIDLQPFGGDARLRGESIATQNWVNNNYWQKFELGYRGINDNDTRNFSFLTSNGYVAKKINVGGLLVSNAFQDEGLIPTNGAYIKGDINTGASCWIGNRLITNGSIKHNNLGLSLVNVSGSGFFSSVLIKTGLTSGNMGTFTVKLYRYAHEYFEFNVNNYKYNDSNYLPNITWKSGDSNAITRIEFLKDSNNVLYVNVVMPMPYPRLAVTDLMVYGWDDVPFDSFNWGAEFDGDTTGFINQVQALPSNFLRDTHFTNQLTTKIDAGDNNTKSIGFTGGDIDQAPWIFTGSVFRYLATQTWTNNQFQNYYTKNESLGLFVGLNGVQTIYDTKTFAQSPIVPNATLGNHALNLDQADGRYVNTLYNQDIYGIKKYTGAYTEWVFNNDNNNTRVFVQSLSTRAALGSLNNKDVVLYRNAQEKLLIGDTYSEFFTPLVVPNAIINSHAVNLGQLNTKVTNEDSVRGVAFDSGSATGVPYFIHTNGTYVPMATSSWVQNNYTTQTLLYSELNSYVKINTTFDINTGSGLMIADDYFGSESGIIDTNGDYLVAGKRNGYYKFGSLIEGGGGTVVNISNGHMAYGGVMPNGFKHYFNGTIRITNGISSESTSGEDVYCGDGTLLLLNKEIARDGDKLRYQRFSRHFVGTSNTFGSDHKDIRITLRDGGDLTMEQFYRDQEITIMNLAPTDATFYVNNTAVVVGIPPKSSATFYVDETDRMIQIRLDTDNTYVVS